LNLGIDNSIVIVLSFVDDLTNSRFCALIVEKTAISAMNINTPRT